MHIGEKWRNEIKALLPCGFVRISRDGAFLFVSDYPKRAEAAFPIHEALTRAGFTVTVEGGTAYLDGGREKYREADMPLPVFPDMTEENARLLFAARLLTEKQVPFESQPVQLIRHTLRGIMLEDEKLLLQLPGMIARQKRCKQPLAPAAGKLLLQYLQQKEEEKP